MLRRLPAALVPVALAALLGALLAVAAAPAAAGAPGELRVAAVQLRISPAELASWDSFRGHIERLVERCLQFRPELILFPEYASAFLALLPYGGLIRDAGSVEQALRRALEREPLARDLRDLFLLNSGLAERAARELFGGLARRHGVSIGAGSWFAAESSGGRIVLVNRAVIFDERGGELYAQDKVFLTVFEEELLGLVPGRLEAARPFLVRDRRVALTLCRDTFFADWERILREAELWVDLKANGEAFTAQVSAAFQRALPARLPGAGVPYGLTLCLTGGLAGLVWEGESSLVFRDPDGGLRVLLRADSPAGEDILFFTLPAPEVAAAADRAAPSARGGSPSAESEP
jgi:predicted amidohydrolase